MRRHKSASRQRGGKQPVAKAGSASVPVHSAAADGPQHDGADHYQDSLLAFRKLLIEYENQIVLLKEQNLILAAEKQVLSDTVKEYEVQFRQWQNEQKRLIHLTQQSMQEAKNCKQTKSFRLGYALMFGFKSWKGFKHLCRTVLALCRERKHPVVKSAISPVQTVALQGLSKKQPDWESQKPVLQWSLPADQPYLSDWMPLRFNSSETADTEVLPKEGVETELDCAGFRQIVVRVQVFSEIYPDTPKQALLSIAFYNEAGMRVQPVLHLPFSQRLDKHYFYLNADAELNDYVFLPVPSAAVKVVLGLVPWDAKDLLYYHTALSVSGYSDGISVVVPTYRGEQTIIKCLQSLANQTLPFTEFEVLVVINGEQDATPDLIERFREKAPHMNLRVFELEEGNVGKARNYAVAKAQKGWITFIDDDDYVSENYLNALYRQAAYHNVTVTGIEDIVNGEAVGSSVMEQLDRAAAKNDIGYFDVTSSLTMNACKLAPAFMVKSVAYRTDLRSGEDVVYWCSLLNRFRPKITLLPSYREDSYKRLVRAQSVSRQEESYDFNVLQRLEVIKLLEAERSNSQYQHLEHFIQSKIDAQAGFIHRYLQKYPQDYPQYRQDLERLAIDNPFIGEINSLFADTLVISYCFAPYIDTSGVVMSKRIHAMGKPVDLISNSMNRVRECDFELLQITRYDLGIHHELNAPQAFANWKAIAQFADNTLDAVHQLLKQREAYQNLYSRAMWPASHIAAALVKSKYPQMKWIAEFSDPILMDVSGRQREEELPAEWLVRHGFLSREHIRTGSQNLFDWCERLPYLYADELVFTNTNQLEYMLSYADENLRESIRKKAVILPQPTLDRHFYRMSEIKLEKEAEQFYLAYFGSFYVNRGFKPFVDAWIRLPEAERCRLKLYVYTQQETNTVLADVPSILHNQIVIQKYVGYFDFLALADQFDGLLVMDAQTQGLKINNPYLPSKLSDYLGSTTPTFALVEPGSTMDKFSNIQFHKANMYSSSDISEIILLLIHS